MRILHFDGVRRPQHPTLILFRDGKLVERIVGYRPKDQLLQQISDYLPPA